MPGEEEVGMEDAGGDGNWGGGVKGGGCRWTQDTTLRDQRKGHSPGAQLPPLPPFPGPDPLHSIAFDPRPRQEKQFKNPFQIKHRGKGCPMLERQFQKLT